MDLEFANEVSQGNALTFVKFGRAKGIVQPDAWCGKRTIVGRKPNQDTFATWDGCDGQTGAGA